MNKGKLKHLPFNLFFCLPSAIAVFLLITLSSDLNVWSSIGIAFYFYLIDVRQACENDFLEERIRHLEDTQIINAEECDDRK